MFVGLRRTIARSNFNFFSFSKMFLNQEYLKIENTIFTHGIGSLLYSDNSDLIKELYDKSFDQNNPPTNLVDQTSEKKLFIIRDCTFTSLSGSDFLINLDNNYATFYMTSCTFQKCNYNRGLQQIRSRATTYSHICFSDTYHGYNDQLDGIFINSVTPPGSFFKIYYSSIVGDKQESNAAAIIFLNGYCSFQYQCMNVSNFKLKYRDNYFVAATKISGQKCLNMMMCTFYKLDIRYSFYVNPQDGDVGYHHYIGLCNFFDNNFENAIDIDMNQNTNACVDGCIFKNSNEVNKANIFHFDRKPINCILRIENCIFETSYNIVGDQPFIEDYNNKVIDIPTSINLAHFIVPDVCEGVQNDDAFGCKNGNCPEQRGCDADAFEFKPDDVTYSEKFHPDVDTPTPTPTGYFSESFKFSKSSVFSDSDDFSKSMFFSKSGVFSKTDAFSCTDDFTQSVKFSESMKFSKSKDFSPSKKFTPSDDPERTSFFTKSDDFSISDIFSKSFDFTYTKSFSKSNDFSNSKYFSKSDKFTKSADFSGSKEFSASKTNEYVPPIIVDRDESNSNDKLKPGAIAGIVVAAVAAAIIIALIIFFVIRKHRLQMPDEEDVETIDNNQSTTTNDNPIYDVNGADDPFKEDFNNE